MPIHYIQIYQIILMIIGKSLYEGAKTSLYCSLSNEAIPGEFHSDCQQSATSPLASNHPFAEECWTISEELIHEKTQIEFHFSSFDE